MQRINSKQLVCVHDSRCTLLVVTRSTGRRRVGADENTRASRSSADSLARLRLLIFPASEKTLTDGADIAAVGRYFGACILRAPNRPRFCLHQLSGSPVFWQLGLGHTCVSIVIQFLLAIPKVHFFVVSSRSKS
jgi:hypothetical protein